LVLQDGNAGDVGQRSRELHVGLRHRSGLRLEQVQRSDDAVSQPERERVHALVSGADGVRSEPRPSLDGVAQLCAGHQLPRRKGLQARSLFVLQLEQLEQACLLGGRRHHSQVAVCVGEQDPDGVSVDEFDASVGQHRQQVDDVEVGHESVRKLEERAGDE
jgi:hypothetical protein